MELQLPAGISLRDMQEVCGLTCERCHNLPVGANIVMRRLISDVCFDLAQRNIFAFR